MKQPIEEFPIDLSNSMILEAHLQCAAQEMPINVDEDNVYFGPMLKSTCEARLSRDNDGWYVILCSALPHILTRRSLGIIPIQSSYPNHRSMYPSGGSVMTCI